MNRVFDAVTHFWGGWPGNVIIPCPVVEGMPADPSGYIELADLSSAWNLIFVMSLVLVICLVIVCYLKTRYTTGTTFGRRWLWFLASAALGSAAVRVIILFVFPFVSMRGSCATAPSPFSVSLPTGLIINSTVWGLVWGALFFVVFSLLGTQMVGRASNNGGFYHNRAIPFPRFPWT